MTSVRNRERMVEQQIVRRGILNRAVTTAMLTVPREFFVDPGYEEFAYEDSPLAIGSGQTISQPFIVAIMLEKASLDAGDTIVEIGTGSDHPLGAPGKRSARSHSP